MAMYQRGETVICALTIMKAGALHDPLTSTQITIMDGRGAVLVNLADMVNDSTGQFHYDFASAVAHSAGRYRARFTTIDSGRTTIIDHSFELEDGAG